MKYYIPAYGGPRPYKVLGTVWIEMDESKPINQPAFVSKNDSLKLAEAYCEKLNNFNIERMTGFRDVGEALKFNRLADDGYGNLIERNTGLSQFFTYSSEYMP